MKNNPLKQLDTLGQSLWLDYIRWDLIASVELSPLIHYEVHDANDNK